MRASSGLLPQLLVVVLMGYLIGSYLLQVGAVLYLEVTGVLGQDNGVFWMVVPITMGVVGMALFCYHLTVVTEPGSPPANLNDIYPNKEEIRQKAKRTQDLRKRLHESDEDTPPHMYDKLYGSDEVELLRHVGWCFKCQRVKEVRVHHCKRCGVCVLRMDHHCPWIGGCIGRYNHKYFLLFLLYSTVVGTTIQIGLLFIASHILVDHCFQGKWLASHYQNYQLANYYCLGWSSAILAIAIGLLLAKQVCSLAKNLTTIQTYVEGIQLIKPWMHNTFAENMQQVFGESSWLLPTPPFTAVSQVAKIDCQEP